MFVIDAFFVVLISLIWPMNCKIVLIVLWMEWSIIIYRPKYNWGEAYNRDKYLMILTAYLIHYAK